MKISRVIGKWVRLFFYVVGIATLLSIISKSDRDFPTLVLQKLEFVTLNYLEEDDVLASKLCLRALASMASSKAISIDGGSAFLSVLQVLRNEILAILYS